MVFEDNFIVWHCYESHLITLYHVKSNLKIRRPDNIGWIDERTQVKHRLLKIK